MKKKPATTMPVQKWLSMQQAMSFLDMSKNTFLEISKDHNLTVSVIGAKKYFRVDQLENLINESIIIK